MKKDKLMNLLEGEIFEDAAPLSLGELCRACRVPAEQVYELVAEGVIEPLGREPGNWRFARVTVRRVRCAQRLRHDLGVNTAGAALAIDLLEEMQRLRARLRRLESGAPARLSDRG